MAKKYHAGGITVELESSEDTLLIEAYGDGGFRLLEKRVDGSIYVNSDGFYPIKVQQLADLTPQHLDMVLDSLSTPEILIVGTGEAMMLLPKELRLHLERKDVGYDVMSTGAAARTYNVLTLEGRRVLAILIQVP